MSNDKWKNMISYELNKMKKDSYGKMVDKEMTADEYWDQEEKDLNESYKESLRQRDENKNRKRINISKAPKVF
tara:strand:+ start:731 stop:949 length:219 start_codon:yes stop_codon:yes gene_type:complete